jgi:PAS domain S-box-containing protein
MAPVRGDKMNKPDESKIPSSMPPDKTPSNLQDDISAERMLAKEALRISEENFLSLISHNADGVVILYSHTTVFANNRICKITGYSQDEILGKNYVELVAPEYHELLKANYEMKLVDGEPNALDMKIIARDGRKVDVETRGQAIVFKGRKATMVTIRDVTERKQAEDALKLSEQNFRNSMDNSAIGIRISDNNDRTSYVNKAFLDIFGYKDIHEVRSSPPQEHYSPEAHAAWVLRHEKLLRGEPMPKQIDVDIIRKDGTVRNLTVSMMDVYWDGAQQHQTLYNDVTESKQMSEKLVVSERFASIGQLSAGIAHELNNPLTSILGFSNVILEGDVPADLKEELQIISTEAQRASRILKGLLTFVRKDDSQKVRVNVNRIIESVLELRANEQTTNNIRVHTRFDRGLPEIMADPFQMQQVFLNIVINAEYFMTEAHKQGNLTVSTQKSGDMVRIVFTDDGPGIAPENLKHVFDPFYTTKGVGKGTGLGLSICHGIVTAHGGRIYAESAPGKGASFIVELPFQ